MSSPASGVLRLTRAAVLGGATVGLSLGAHVAGGGEAPTPVGLGLLALPVLAMTLLATGRRLSGPAVTALVGLGQVGLHLGLSALTVGPTAGDGGGGAAGTGSSPADGHHLLHLTLAAPLPAGAPGAADGSALLMTLAHVVAASLVALLLSRGEQALWALVTWLLPRLPGAARPPAGLGRAPVTAVRALSSSRRVGRHRSRAPPAGAAAVLAHPSSGPVGPLPASA